MNALKEIIRQALLKQDGEHGERFAVVYNDRKDENLIVIDGSINLNELAAAITSETGRKIYETSQSCADGYRRNISADRSSHENEISEQCAVAASNVGYFTLKALGYTNEEIEALKKDR